MIRVNVIKFLGSKGFNTVVGEFYGYINLWERWYKSDVFKFHNYRIYNGTNHINCRLFALGMAKNVCEDIADLLMNEKVSMVVNDDAADKFVESIFNSNNAYTLLNQYQEKKSYSGTTAYVPYLDGIEVDENGVIIPGTGTVKINFFEAQDIYPLSWHNGIITECAFVNEKIIKKKPYSHIQIHTLQNGQYVIENKVVSGKNGEMTQEQWQSIEQFASLVERTETGSATKQFVIDKLNIVNNVDTDNPMGIALFANAIDQIKGSDIIYDSYINEFKLGKKRIFVAPQMMNTNEFGDKTFDVNDVVFYQLPEDSLKEKPIVEVNMDIRSEDHNRGINDALSMVSLKCGFGTKRYVFENGSITTATQVISEDSDMFRTLKKHEIILNDVLVELITIILELGVVIGAVQSQEYDIAITFDDSIIEDKETERQRDREDVAMGAMSMTEYRMKWYGEDEATATKKLPEQTVTAVLE